MLYSVTTKWKVWNRRVQWISALYHGNYPFFQIWSNLESIMLRAASNIINLYYLFYEYHLISNFIVNLLLKSYCTAPTSTFKTVSSFYILACHCIVTWISVKYHPESPIVVASLLLNYCFGTYMLLLMCYLFTSLYYTAISSCITVLIFKVLPSYENYLVLNSTI